MMGTPRIEREGDDIFLRFDDGTKQKVNIIPPWINVQVMVTMPSGEIFPPELAVAVLRAELDWWRALAEKRGEELANLRGGAK